MRAQRALRSRLTGTQLFRKGICRHFQRDDQFACTCAGCEYDQISIGEAAAITLAKNLASLGSQGEGKETRYLEIKGISLGSFASSGRRQGHATSWDAPPATR